MNNKQKALPAYLLLILFPAVFGLLLYFTVLKIDKNHEIENIKSKLSERALDFIGKSNAVDYFKPHFKQLNKSLLPFIDDEPNQSGSEQTKAEVTQIIEDYCKKLNENIRVAIFNKEGKLINTDNLQDFEIRFYQWAWYDIHGFPNPHYNGRRADQALIMGREFNDEVMYNQPEVCIPTNSLGKTGVFYFCNGNKASNGIIIFVEYKRTNLEILEAKSKDYSTADQPLILYSKNEKKCLSPNLKYKELSYEETSSDKFLNGFLEDDMVWKGFNADDYKLLAGQKLENPEKYKNLFNKAIFIFILILSVATIFFFRNIANLGGIHISIRYKLVFIFALAVYMPALSLWVLSYTSIHDRRTAIENDTKKGMLEVLNEIDLGHQASIEDAKECYHKLDRYIESLSGKPLPTSSEIDAKIREILGDRDYSDVFNWLDVRTSDLTQVYTNHKEESNNRLKPIGRILALNGIEKYCPERLAKAGLKKSPSDILVGDFMGNPIIGFSSIFERPHETIFQYFEGSGIYWYWNYFSDENNPIAFYIGNTALRYTTMSYFRSVLKKRYNYENANLKLICFQTNVIEYIPEIASKYPDIYALIEVSSMNQTIETATVNYLDSQYYCICMPGNNIKNCYLLCLYPLTEIDYKIEQIRSTIYSIIMILLVISIFTALLLARTFIVPVNELDKGLTALRKRDTETRVNIENNDELGQLGTAFNQMMTEIKDMLLAGAVQQCLIPTGEYKIEGYDCRVYNQMATDVGGDYADIFELPGDRLLIVIGDVTGHGISSAFLTAMVKGSVYRFAHKDTPLTEIVTQISNMIFELLKKKKLMTFCAIVLDKLTGEISMCNAGHPYPIIHSGKGVTRTIDEDGFPLGVSPKRSRHSVANDSLKPDETLILFTDGFPEAEDANGKAYSYKAFNKFIENSSIDSAESLENELKSEFLRYHGNAELSDDVTFIILKRLKKEASIPSSEQDR